MKSLSCGSFSCITWSGNHSPAAKAAVTRELITLSACSCAEQGLSEDTPGQEGDSSFPPPSPRHPPCWFTVPPPAVSHPPCPRSQRCRWMGYWNQTPGCSGWMGFSCALVSAAKKWCRTSVKGFLLGMLLLLSKYVTVYLSYLTHFKFLCPTLKIHINTSKCKSDIEARFKNSALIKGSSWHQMPSKCEHANQSSGLCCWQHPPRPSLNTQPSIKSSSTLIFNSFSNTLAMLNLKKFWLGFEILKSYCWRVFFLFVFLTQHLHMNITDTKAKQEQAWASFCWDSQTSLSISQSAWRTKLLFQGMQIPVQRGILRNIKQKLPTNGSSN